MFHDFCEDQLVSKGYFDPNEAYEEWPSFVNERNETAREMNGIAEGLVPAATQKVTGANIQVKKEDQVEEEDKMIYMWLCLNMPLTSINHCTRNCYDSSHTIRN